MNKKFKLDKRSIFYSIIIFFLSIISIGFLIIIPKIFFDMVHIGINYKGIVEPIPNIISTRSMSSLISIMQNEELLNYYELIKKGDKSYVDKYEVLNKQDIYILKSNVDKKSLKKLLAKPEAFYFLLSSSEELQRMGFKPDATVINYYMGLTDDNEIKRIHSSLEEMDTSTLNQYAINFILSEYNDLNYDITSIQRNYLISTIITIIFLAMLWLVSIIIIKKLTKKLTNKLTYIKED